MSYLAHDVERGPFQARLGLSRIFQNLVDCTGPFRSFILGVSQGVGLQGAFQTLGFRSIYIGDNSCPHRRAPSPLPAYSLGPELEVHSSPAPRLSGCRTTSCVGGMSSKDAVGCVEQGCASEATCEDDGRDESHGCYPASATLTPPASQYPLSALHSMGLSTGEPGTLRVQGLEGSRTEGHGEETR